MKLSNTFLSILLLILFSLLNTACDKTTQQPDSRTLDGQSLNFAYFINDVANHTAPVHQSISAVLASRCGDQACHGVGGNNGGAFKIFNPPDTNAKHISNFISAQAQVIKGPEDPLAVTNTRPQAHTSPLLLKPLSELAGGNSHKGNITPASLFTVTSESIVNAGGTDYGEIYRWIAFTP